MGVVSLKFVCEVPGPDVEFRKPRLGRKMLGQGVGPGIE